MTEQQEAAMRQALEYVSQLVRTFGTDTEAAKVQESLLQAFEQQPAALVQENPSDIDLQGCWVEKSDGTIDGIASMRLALRRYGLANPPIQPAAWVGLTDEEIDKIENRVYCKTMKVGKPPSVYISQLCRAIEAKLRSKNGGDK